MFYYLKKHVFWSSAMVTSFSTSRISAVLQSHVPRPLLIAWGEKHQTHFLWYTTVLLEDALPWTVGGTGVAQMVYLHPF